MSRNHFKTQLRNEVIFCPASIRRRRNAFKILTHLFTHVSNIVNKAVSKESYTMVSKMIYEYTCVHVQIFFKIYYKSEEFTKWMCNLILIGQSHYCVASWENSNLQGQHTSGFSQNLQSLFNKKEFKIFLWHICLYFWFQRL